MKNKLIKQPLLAILAISLFSQVTAQSPVEVLLKSGDSSSSVDRFLYFARQNNSHHRPASFMSAVRQDFGERGIQFTTSVNSSDLNLDNLNRFNGVFFFGNHDNFTTAQTNAIESYVGSGGGMVGMHVIAYVARSNPALRRLLGGAFRGHHAISTFTSPLIQSPETYPTNLANHAGFPFPEGETYLFEPNHPILEGLAPYTSADEPYLHQLMNPDIILLGYREDHGGWDEPYTWVRHEGSGRVFYHANGHDARTWSQPNFRELMIRGTSWVSNPESQSYQTFFPPIISDQGGMQHLGIMTTADGPRFGIHSNGRLSAMSDLQIPGDDETLRYDLSDQTRHTMIGADQIALATRVQSPNGELSALLIGHMRYPELIALTTGSADALEAGFRYSANQDFPFTSNTEDAVLFPARIEDSAGGNQKNVLARYQNGTLEPLLIEGDPLPSDPATTVISLPDQLISFFSSNQTAIIADLQTDSGSPISHILTGESGNLIPRLAIEESSPGLPPNVVFDEFLHAIAIQDDTLFFTARLTGESTDETNDEVIASANPLGEITLMLREGDLVHDQPVSFPAGTPPPFARQNDLLYSGILSGNSSLISLKEGREPLVLVSEGQSLEVAGQPHLIKELDSASMMASTRQVVLPAVLLAPDGLTEFQVLLQVGSGTIRPLIQEGAEIATLGGAMTVSEVACHPSGPHGGGMSENQIVAVVHSPEGESAIVEIGNIDDLDQDEIPDTIESAFGGSLTEVNSSLPPGYPKISMTNGDEITLSYWRFRDPTSNLNYAIQVSRDLETWTTISPEISPADDQSGVPDPYQKMVATLTITDESRFFRFHF